MANTLATTAFISLNDIINNFIISYTGPGKLIPDSKRTEVIFHARRCLQEFAYETLKSKFTIIPKLAEEALYACMVYAILANRENTNPNTLQRLLIEKIDKLERSKSRLIFTNFSE